MFVIGEATTRGLRPHAVSKHLRVSPRLRRPRRDALGRRLSRDAPGPVVATSTATRRHRRATPARLAAIVVGFLVLNPMVPFVSSGINPDAVNVPLAALSILLVWQVMSTGTGAGLAALALIATAWTKPSGLQMIPAFAATGAALWVFGQITFERLRLTAAVVFGSAAIAWCGFYAWSPPRFVGGPPVVDRWTTYLGTRWLELPWTWQTYWGTLGWLEYSAARHLVSGLLAPDRHQPDLRPAARPHAAPVRRLRGDLPRRVSRRHTRGRILLSADGGLFPAGTAPAAGIAGTGGVDVAPRASGEARLPRGADRDERAPAPSDRAALLHARLVGRRQRTAVRCARLDASSANAR